MPAVVTFDLQLYEKAQKLMSREDMKGRYVLRIGELHTVFASLKALGKYIEGSGIDQVWVEAGMYSPTTVRQILEGKHLYCAMEAHLTTMVALYGLLFKELWEDYKDEQTVIEELGKEMNKAFRDGQLELVQELHDKIKKEVEIIDLQKKLCEYEERSKGTKQFILHYISRFETILKHVRDSCQGDWRLHLAAQEELTKYFFAHNQLNYARLSSLYWAEMQELEHIAYTLRHGMLSNLETFVLTKVTSPSALLVQIMAQSMKSEAWKC